MFISVKHLKENPPENPDPLRFYDHNHSDVQNAGQADLVQNKRGNTQDIGYRRWEGNAVSLRTRRKQTNGQSLTPSSHLSCKSALRCFLFNSHGVACSTIPTLVSVIVTQVLTAQMH